MASVLNSSAADNNLINQDKLVDGVGSDYQDKIDWSKFPGIPFALPMEENFDVEYHCQWFKDNWYISIYISIIYVTFVFMATKFMKNREKYDLRLPLTLWSISLCTFSFMATLRIVPELWNTFKELGFVGSVIDTSFRKDKRVLFWIWLFVCSKAPELVDTVFIILRKQKLIFLHWYHHFTTLTFCFYVFHEMSGNFRWMTGMNVAIHTAMYGYFALKAMRFNVPNFVNVIITSSQLVQMIVGVAMHVIVCVERSKGVDVQFTFVSSIAGLLLYFGFLILFANFFIQSYLLPACKSKNYSSQKNDCNNNSHGKLNGAAVKKVE